MAQCQRPSAIASTVKKKQAGLLPPVWVFRFFLSASVFPIDVEFHHDDVVIVAIMIALRRTRRHHTNPVGSDECETAGRGRAVREIDDRALREARFSWRSWRPGWTN